MESVDLSTLFVEIKFSSDETYSTLDLMGEQLHSASTPFSAPKDPLVKAFLPFFHYRIQLSTIYRHLRPCNYHILESIYQLSNCRARSCNREGKHAVLIASLRQVVLRLWLWITAISSKDCLLTMKSLFL